VKGCRSRCEVVHLVYIYYEFASGRFEEQIALDISRAE
jgi:hypothetical protein